MKKNNYRSTLDPLFVVLFLAFTMLSQSCHRQTIEDITKFKWSVTGYQETGSNPAYSKTDYSLDFEGNEYKTQLDVNYCAGSYTISSNGSINFNQAGCTEMCCDSDFAIKFMELLLEISQWEVSNNELTLTSEGITIWLQRTD